MIIMVTAGTAAERAGCSVPVVMVAAKACEMAPDAMHVKVKEKSYAQNVLMSMMIMMNMMTMTNKT